MPSKSANPRPDRITRRSIVFLVYPNFKLLDLAGPLQAFSDALDDTGRRAYSTAVVSISGATLSSDTPAALTTQQLSSWKRRHIDTLIVVGGLGVFAAMEDPHLLAAVKQLAKKSRRVGSICSGAFVLAACGLLNDCRAVTHWEYCDQLADTFPQVRVQPDQIFVNDNDLWTSAGVTAGIDMAIAMISQDIGRSASLSLARSLVTYHVRPGGQSQFSDVLNLQLTDSEGRFDDLHLWIMKNLRKTLRVEQLADYAAMSPRNFARLYLAHTGRTPAKAVEGFRVEAARSLLDDGMLPINTVATRCGFGDEERMRRSFLRIVKVTPQNYRSRFR